MDDGLNPHEVAILDARTRNLASAARIPSVRPTLTAAIVRVSGERYALDSSIVHGVHAVYRLTPLPWAPPHVAGLILHAGAVLPAFFLGGVLDLPLAALPERGQVVFVGERHPELALVVDEVDQLREIDTEALQPAPPLTGAARALLRGVGPEGVPLVDGARLLASDRLVVDIPSPSRGAR